MANKIRVATTSLAGCFGCHMSFLDIDERMLQLVEHVEFDRSPITDIEHCTNCDIGLIEGGVCNSENVHVLLSLDKTARFWWRSVRVLLTAACLRCVILSLWKNASMKRIWMALVLRMRKYPAILSCPYYWIKCVRFMKS